VRTLSIFTFLALILAGCAKTQDAAGSLSLGALEIRILADAQFERDAAILVSPENPELLGKIPAGFSMTSGVNVVLARYKDEKDEIILFDTGLGRASNGKLLEELEKARIAPDKITGIFITHFHQDHIGGLVLEGKPCFPNAKVYVPQEEADYFLREDLSEIPEANRAQFAAVAGIFAQLKEAGIAVVPFPSGSNLEEYFGGGSFSFLSEPAFGHTPGHTVYMLASQGKELLIWADILHVLDIQLAYPDISATYDMDTGRAVSERKRLLGYAADNGTITAGSHVTAPGLFTISRKEQGFARSGL